eukprot:Skav224027  [mRNA]  locus=scaffold3968:70937:73539:- [translate_table: standard]
MPLEALAMDNGKDPAKFREERCSRDDVASTEAPAGPDDFELQHEKDHFATLAVDAVLRLGGKSGELSVGAGEFTMRRVKELGKRG